MIYQVTFTDGSIIKMYEAEDISYKGSYSNIYDNFFIIIKSTNYTTPNFSKTDLDGHEWVWNGTEFSISGTDIEINVSDNNVVFINNFDGNDDDWGINSFSWGYVYTSTHEWQGINGISADNTSIGSFISNYTDYYRCNNAIKPNILQIDSYSNDGSHFQSNGLSGYGGSHNFDLNNFNKSISEYKEPTDPYDKGGTSGTGGGTGDFDGTSDSIDIPELPSLSAAGAGFITLYNPTQGQLHSLANYLWSDAFDIDTFKKLYADPMSVILGLSIVPVSIPNGGTRTVTVGNRSTGVSMNLAASQYVSIDCGTLNVNEFWGGYLDYSPFTEAEIYLPYIGTHPIATDDIMGKSVHVVYHVDILSGACCAYVKCGNSVLYSFIGQCSSSIPISGNDWTNVINGVLSIAGSIGSMVATGGISAPMEIGNIASNAINSSKPKVEKSGALGGTGGLLNIQKPYLILTRPKQALPAFQNNYTGYPSFITEKFSNLTGYTEVYKTHLESIQATDTEISEIESLLKSGVIF